jgi:hypothetical protein
MKVFGEQEGPAQTNNVGPSFLVMESAAKQLASAVKCQGCDGPCTLLFDQHALQPTFTVRCECCETDVFTTTPPEVTGLDGKKSKLEGKKLCMVYDSLVSGTGFAGLLATCQHLGVCVMYSRQYLRYASFLYENIRILWQQQQEKILRGLRRAHSQDAAASSSADSCLQIDVSYDGTWMTRGHRSHVGVAFVIEAELGCVVDFEVLSNFCQECFKKEKQVSPEAFAAWKRGHTRCMKNFDGKSGSMETEAALRMWQRSEARGLQYKTFIGDGDSSAFNAVSQLHDGRGPYDTPVVKEECINHISKRLGTRLRNLKKNLRVSVTTKKGKTVQRSLLAGKRGLTDASIDKLTQFYGQNIRAQKSSDTVEMLRNRLLSSYYHARSSDDNPSHHYCPAGESSWCFWKRAEATGEEPEPHSSKNLYLSGLDPALLKKILEVYIDLTSSNLLLKCLKHRTQNSNESLHSKLWRKCLKIKHAGLERVVFAATVTALEHNFGSADGSLLAALGLMSDSAQEDKRKNDRTPSKSPSVKRRRPADDAPGPSSGYGPGAF